MTTTYVRTYIYTDTNPITLPCSLARVGNKKKNCSKSLKIKFIILSLTECRIAVDTGQIPCNRLTCQPKLAHDRLLCPFISGTRVRFCGELFFFFFFFSRQNRILSRKQILTYIGRVGPKETGLQCLNSPTCNVLLDLSDLLIVRFVKFVTHCLISSL